MGTGPLPGTGPFDTDPLPGTGPFDTDPLPFPWEDVGSFVLTFVGSFVFFGIVGFLDGTGGLEGMGGLGGKPLGDFGILTFVGAVVSWLGGTDGLGPVRNTVGGSTG